VPEGAPGRVLGLDLGQARIGVSISDDRRTVAVPLGTIHTGAPQDVKALAAIVRDHDVVEIVVGLPVSMSGREGEAAGLARAFAKTLESYLNVPVHLHDERLTTVEAERALRERGVGRRTRREVVDQAAATLILQAWLDARR
jgi:putative holliday junction resolvase